MCRAGRWPPPAGAGTARSACPARTPRTQMETLLTHPGVDPGWTVRWQPAPGARLRLFCLPHAGGGAAVYRMWGKELGPEVEVIAIRPPGRESRYLETPISDMDTMVND